MRQIETTFDAFGAKLLLIGLKGESNATEILIDCADALEEYQGTMAAMSITGPDGTVYPGNITLDEDGIVHWVVPARDCSIEGHGSARVDLVDDDGTVVASAEATTIIVKTKMQNIAPDQITDWTDAASVALQEVRAALVDLIDFDNTAEANEAARQLAETGRVNAETARVSEFNTIRANAQAALSYLGESEDSSTASAVHAAGTYLIYNGKIYKVTADIAIGDTLAETGDDANIEQVPDGVMAEMTRLKTKFITPQMFGALANGTDNDYDGISGAYTHISANGGIMYFPKGNYTIKNSNKIIPCSNSITIIDPDATFSGVSAVQAFLLNNDNITIFFNGALINGTGFSSHPVNITGENISIYDVHVEGTVGDHDGIYIGSGAKHTKVIRGYIKNARRNGISVCDAMHTIIDGVIVDTVSGGTVQAGVDVEANSYNANYDTTIKNCVFKDCTRMGICVSFGRKVNIVNNIIENTQTGISVGIGGAEWNDGTARIGYDKIFVTAYDPLTGYITLNKAQNADIKEGYDLRFYANGDSVPTELSNVTYAVVCKVHPEYPNKVIIGKNPTEPITAFTNVPDTIENAYINIYNRDQTSEVVVDGNTIVGTTQYGIDSRMVPHTIFRNNSLIRCEGNNGIKAQKYSVITNTSIYDFKGTSFCVTIESYSYINGLFIEGCANGIIYVPAVQGDVTIENLRAIDVYNTKTTSFTNLMSFGSNNHNRKVTLQNVYIQCRKTATRGIEGKNNTVLIGCTVDDENVGTKYYGIPEGNMFACS